MTGEDRDARLEEVEVDVKREIYCKKHKHRQTFVIIDQASQGFCGKQENKHRNGWSLPPTVIKLIQQHYVMTD